jgi:membrane-associated protease RseP (regulator of RpoE activity)
MRFAQIRHAASAVSLLAMVLGAGALAQEHERRGRFERDAIVGEPQADVDFLYVVGAEEKDEDAKRSAERFELRLSPPAELGYWIGLQLDPPNDTLRKQLGLAEGTGLVVTQLFPDTPAVKAGFAVHDVVVKVDDKPLSDVDSFNKIVQEAKDQTELSVSLIRGGKEQVIKVTPAKRPTNDRWEVQLAPQNLRTDAFLEWMPKGLDLEHPMRVEFFNPGLVVGKSYELRVGDLPKDLTISISKTGEEPAKITASRGDDKWSATEKELHTLPDDIRGHVERMLRPVPREARVRVARPRVEFTPRAIVTPRLQMNPAPQYPPTPVAPSPAVVPQAPADVQKRLDDVNKRLDEVQKALETLLKQRAEAQP